MPPMNQQKRIEMENMRAALGIRQRRGMGQARVGMARPKIAMQAARKGVQKAKRLLINKRRAPIQQMMVRSLKISAWDLFY